MYSIGMADVEEIIPEHKSKIKPPEINIDSLFAKNQINKFLNSDEDAPRVKIDGKTQHEHENKELVGEKLSENEILLISRKIQSDLDTLEYHVIPKKSDLFQELLNEIDIVAFKIIQVN